MGLFSFTLRLHSELRKKATYDKVVRYGSFKIIQGTQLPVVSSCRDLGVTVNKDLSPSEHITDIVARALRRANLIHICFVSWNVILLLRAF